MSAAHTAPLTPSLEVTLKNILVTTDFSACSEAAVKIAASLARQHQSQLILLHTIEFDPMLPNPGGADHNGMRARAGTHRASDGEHPQVAWLWLACR